MTTIKADIAAAERVLNAAVRKARAQMAESDCIAAAEFGGIVWTWRAYDREAIVEMLEHAGYAAEVLLEGRAS